MTLYQENKKERKAAYNKWYRATHLQQIKAHDLLVKDKRNLKRRTRLKSAPDKYRPKYWAEQLRTKYGLSVPQYQEMLEEQAGLCAICGRHHLEFKRRLAVDHNHTTGNIRGLLCPSCNSGMGKLQDSIQLLTAAIEYLKRKEGKLIDRQR